MSLTYLKNTATLRLDLDRCSGCGSCFAVCPHGVFEMNGDKVRIVALDRCMECGACAQNCPTQALVVNAGVGCAQAIITGWFTGKEPSCGCGDDGCC
jgi:NAD-dependent dihydropyrimidine dehydrogenase PreA subunit